MREEIVENLKQPSQWLRIIFMLGFAVALYVAGIVLLVITLVQALFSLLTTKDNEKLRNLGASLARYVFEILQFLTYNSEAKPFPFAEFSFGDDDADARAAETVDASKVDSPVAAAPVNESANTTADTAADKTASTAAKPRRKSPTKKTAKPADTVKTDDPLQEGNT